MNLLLLEWAIQWAGALLALTTLALVFVGIWRGVGRAPGRAVGRGTGWLRSPLFYLIVSSFYIFLSVILWRPLPVSVSTAARGWALLIGSLVYFPGMLLTLWGRLALGGMYFVSTGFGAQLYAGHRLITRGPYAIVRHPMYAGLIAAAIGSLLIYRTWTALIFAACAPFLMLRARREEQALETEFGEQWRAYQRRVPRFLPRAKWFSG